MGNIQSNQTKQVLSDFTNIVNNTSVSVFNNATQNCTGFNDLSVVTGGGQYCNFDAYNSQFNYGQNATTKCNLDSKNINSVTADFTNKVTNQIQQYIQQSAASKQGWFATAFSLEINGASSTDDIMTIIKNEFKSNFNNNCDSVNQAFNRGNVTLCGTYDFTTVNVTQDAIVTALTSCVNENMVKIWTSNAVLNQLWQCTDQALASQQSGLDFGWLSIVLIVCCVVLLLCSSLAVGILFIKEHKSS